MTYKLLFFIGTCARLRQIDNASQHAIQFPVNKAGLKPDDNMVVRNLNAILSRCYLAVLSICDILFILLFGHICVIIVDYRLLKANVSILKRMH